MSHRLIGMFASLMIACTGGPTGTEAGCVVNADCTDGGICNEGECRVVCNQDVDCADTEVCEEPGFCVAATSGECRDTSKCNDGNVCTYDLCDSGHACANIPLTGAACDDGDPCTSSDECTAGGCAGESYTCDDSETCTVDSCDGDGGCFHQNTCECLENPECDDANECTTEICDDGSCVYTPVTGCCNVVTEATDCVAPSPACDPNTHACVACTHAGFCRETAAPHCSPDRTCVACTEVGHCADDGDFCSGDEYCELSTFSCVSEGNPCKDSRQPDCNEAADRCDCTSAPVSCGLLTCNAATGECEGCTGDPDCDDDNPCTLDDCDGVSGVCSNPDDTSLCTAVPGHDTCFPDLEVPGAHFCACTFQSTCPNNFECFQGACSCLMSDDECGNGLFCDGDEVCVADTSGFGSCVGGTAPCTDDQHPVCNDTDDRCECTSVSCTGGRTCLDDDQSPGHMTCVIENCRIPGDEDYDGDADCEDSDCDGEVCQHVPLAVCNASDNCQACENINCGTSACPENCRDCVTCEYDLDSIDLCIGDTHRCPLDPP